MYAFTFVSVVVLNSWHTKQTIFILSSLLLLLLFATEESEGGTISERERELQLDMERRCPQK